MSNKLQLFFTQFKIVKNETTVDFNDLSLQSYLKILHCRVLYWNMCWWICTRLCCKVRGIRRQVALTLETDTRNVCYKGDSSSTWDTSFPPVVFNKTYAVLFCQSYLLFFSKKGTSLLKRINISFLVTKKVHVFMTCLEE